MKTFTLICGMVIETDGKGSGDIQTQLRARDPMDGKQIAAAFDAVESLVLAHACAGIDVESIAYQDGIQTTLDALGHEFEDDEKVFADVAWKISDLTDVFDITEETAITFYNRYGTELQEYMIEKAWRLIDQFAADMQLKRHNENNNKKEDHA